MATGEDHLKQGSRFGSGAIPVIARELRAAGHQHRTWTNRCLLVFVTVLILGFALWDDFNDPPVQLGRELFAGGTVVAAVLAGLSGLITTADCLSREKREGTLGLLFLTPLQPSDVVLGKLGGGSFRCLYLMFGLVPVLSVPVLLGGVTGAQLVLLSILLPNIVFLSSAIGLYASAVCKREPAAILLTLGHALAITGIPFGIAGFLENNGFHNMDFLRSIASFTPMFSIRILIPQPWLAFTSAPFYFGLSLVVQNLIGWVYLWRAMAALRRRWKHTETPTRLTRAAERLQEWSFGKSEQRRKRRSRLLDIHPILWLNARERARNWMAWAVVSLPLCLLLFGRLLGNPSAHDCEVIASFNLITLAFIKIWVAGEASRRIVEDSRDGTLEMIFTSGLRRRDYWLGQARGLIHLFGKPVAVYLVLIGLWYGTGINFHTDSVFKRPPAFVLHQIVSLLDLATIAVFAAALGTHSRNRGPVVLCACFIVLTLQVALGLGVSGQLMSLQWRYRAAAGSDGWITAIYYGFGFLLDLAILTASLCLLARWRPSQEPARAT